MTYSVVLLKPARKALDALDAVACRRVTKALRGLERDPRPAGMNKLSGSADLYRIRIGDWRVIYAIQENKLLVLIIQVGHRREIYRRLPQ